MNENYQKGATGPIEERPVYFEGLINELKDISTTNLGIIGSIMGKLDRIKPMPPLDGDGKVGQEVPVVSVAECFDAELSRQRKIRNRLSDIDSYLSELV